MRCVLGTVLTLVLTGCGASVKIFEGPESDKMLRVQGDRIVNGAGQTVWLRGVAFGNQVWNDVPVPTTHHAKVDYGRVAAMGMNTVRFYLNYVTFEDDEAPGEYKSEGWQWLDRNVEWAKKHGIYLVLNMHVPPGGFQSGNRGKALWDEPLNRERLIRLWQAIAERYRDEPAIAGYDLLNEPVVSRSREQWHALAAEMIPRIRKVDPYHILFVERVNAVDGDWTEDDRRNFFLVDDPNVVYEFHFYKPFHFTHQSASWVEFAAKETSWPDPNRVGIEWFLTDFAVGSYANPKLTAGDSDWTYYEGAPFKVHEPPYVLAKPALVCDRNSGKAYFDDLVLEKIGSDGKTETMWEYNPTTSRGWYFWTENGEGNYDLGRTGHGDRTALFIEKTTSQASLSADIHMFRPEQGVSYKLSGWMKGERIPPEANCQVRLDFLTAKAPIHSWDKAFLKAELDAYLAFGKENHVPLFLGEWGTIVSSFKEGRGGLRWVEDMLDLIGESRLHFIYHDYHESNFGIYYGDSTLPDPESANTPLIELFTEWLSETPPE